MIYTVTMNPSLDYIMRLHEITENDLRCGGTNRANETQYIAGGKGINVSRMLNNLGVDSVAIAITAGKMGEVFEKMTKDYGIRGDFIRLEEGETRINVKIKAGQETEINAPGPVISDEGLEKLFDRLLRLKEGDVLVLAGSILPGMPDDIYGRIMSKISNKGVKVIVDTTGKRLLETLKYHPYLIKPNIAELGELYGVEVNGVSEVEKYARMLQNEGACNVLVSLGADGAVLLETNGTFHKVAVPQGRVVNSVGAGDSMIAGFISGELDGIGIGHAFMKGAACATASTFVEEFATKKEVKNIYNLLTLD